MLVLTFFNGISLEVSFFLCTFANMTYTELFRDWLIKKRIKKKFEDAYNNNRWQGVFNYANKRPPIDWKRDFFTKLMIKEFPHYQKFSFLGPTDIIWWSQNDREYSMWKKLNKEWLEYAIDNQSLIDNP